jgi:hypothetical protein
VRIVRQSAHPRLVPITTASSVRQTRSTSARSNRDEHAACRLIVLFGVVLLLSAPCSFAQESASYRLAEHAFNEGGHPDAGLIVSSASYRITLDAVGDSVTGLGLSSASYTMEGGFVSRYPPPAEVLGLIFLDRTTLGWQAEKSASHYDLYRGLATAVSGSYAGACHEAGIAGETTTDGESPPAAEGFFYLVTATNSLGEEGTRGTRDPGVQRAETGQCL